MYSCEVISKKQQWSPQEFVLCLHRVGLRHCREFDIIWHSVRINLTLRIQVTSWEQVIRHSSSKKAFESSFFSAGDSKTRGTNMGAWTHGNIRNLSAKEDIKTQKMHLIPPQSRNWPNPNPNPNHLIPPQSRNWHTRKGRNTDEQKPSKD